MLKKYWYPKNLPLEKKESNAKHFKSKKMNALIVQLPQMSGYHSELKETNTCPF